MNKEELGYYHVNGIHYPNKVIATLEAQRLGAEVQWYFFDEVFRKFDWTIEPILTLDELYKKRALQIREQYDYVIIRCSGGADSTNALYSFLNNGIHIDEIIADTPWAGLSNWQFNKVDTSVNNCASEFKYAQMPLLNDVATHFPKVKITMRDPFKNLLELTDDEWLYDCNDFINPWTSVQARFDDITHVADMAASGKKIAVISGVDKPILVHLPNGDIFSMISDAPVNAPKQPFKIAYPNVDRVLFYWTPDLPELLIKMSHVVLKAIRLPENKHLFQAMVDIPRYNINGISTEHMTQDQILDYIITKSRADYKPTTNKVYNPFSIYERGIVPYLYPSYTTKFLFQVDKINPYETFFASNNEWFRRLHKDIKVTQMVESNFKAFYKGLSPSYLNPKKTGFKKIKKIFKIASL
jgi:hypothetical protein